MTIQNLKITKQNPLKNICQRIQNTIIQCHAELDKEPTLNSTQKLNLLHWEIGKILYKKKF